ncbi:hypothetical protein D3C87_963300 [compost metagenome]
MKVENVTTLLNHTKSGKNVRVLLTTSDQTQFTMAMLAAMGGHTIEDIYNQNITDEQREATMALYEKWTDDILECGGMLQVLTTLQVPNIPAMLEEMGKNTEENAVFVVENYAPRPTWFDLIPANCTILD